MLTGGDGLLREVSDVGICRALRVLDVRDREPRPTIGAILRVGPTNALDRWVPTAEAQCQRRGEGGSLSRDEARRAPLFATAQWFEPLVEAGDDEPAVLAGLVRVTPDVIRAAVANAPFHRDHTGTGATRVSLEPSRFTVTTPGGFPRGVTEANPLAVSVPRTPLPHRSSPPRGPGRQGWTGRATHVPFSASGRA